MPTLTPEALSAAVAALCADQPIDAVLPALAEALGLVVAHHGCSAEEVIAIVRRVTAEWLGGAPPAGQPGAYE